MSSPRFLLIVTLSLCLGLCTACGTNVRTWGDDDDDSGAGDDDDTTGDDDDTAGDDDDSGTGDDDDSGTGDDDDDDTTGDDDDTTGDDDDTGGGGQEGSGEIIITEIMANPGAAPDKTGEWLELYNTTGAAIDLRDWTLSDLGKDSVTLTSLSVPSGGYAVLVRSATENGSVPYDNVYDGTAFALANSSDEIILEDDTGALIFALSYTGNFPTASGVSTILPSGSMGASAAQSESNWCSGSESPTFGDGDLGTPGTANAACP